MDIPNEPSSGKSIGAACLGAVLGLAVVVVLTILFFQWAGGITPYDIVTLDQQGQLELGGLAIFYMLVVAVVIGAPLGCWLMLRRIRAVGVGATALLTIPWFWPSWTLGLRGIRSGPNDPVILPYAFVGAIVLGAALARVTALLIGRVLRRSEAGR